MSDPKPTPATGTTYGTVSLPSPRDRFEVALQVDGASGGYEYKACQIRLDDGEVYVSVCKHDHPSHLQSIAVPYEEFWEKIRVAFFGEKS